MTIHPHNPTTFNFLSIFVPLVLVHNLLPLNEHFLTTWLRSIWGLSVKDINRIQKIPSSRQPKFILAPVQLLLIFLKNLTMAFLWLNFFTLIFPKEGKKRIPKLWIRIHYLVSKIFNCSLLCCSPQYIFNWVFHSYWQDFAERFKFLILHMSRMATTIN